MKIPLFFKQKNINAQTNIYSTIILPCSGWSTVLWLLGHLLKLLQGQGNISYCFIVIIIRIWFFPQIHDTPRNNEEVWLVRKCWPSPWQDLQNDYISLKKLQGHEGFTNQLDSYSKFINTQYILIQQTKKAQVKWWSK